MNSIAPSSEYLAGWFWDRRIAHTDLEPSRTVSWGYPTETAYYRDASSSDSVLAIRIPYLAVQAADDPVRTSFPKTMDPYQKNDTLTLLVDRCGSSNSI